MSWVNTRRAKNKASNRRRHHEQQIRAAVDDRQKLWATCQWLTAEALHAGAIPEATEYLTTYIHQLAEEGTKP